MLKEYGCRNSGEATQRLGSITEQGSKIVRYPLGQAVVNVLRFDGAMRRWFKRIKTRRKGGQAPHDAARGCAGGASVG